MAAISQNLRCSIYILISYVGETKSVAFYDNLFENIINMFPKDTYDVLLFRYFHHLSVCRRENILR